MTIGPATSSDIRNAMQRFDAELRETADWKNWEDNNSYKFALIDDHGRRYPMKEVISMTTGTPKADFSGGDEAVGFATKLGFNVEAIRLPSEMVTEESPFKGREKVTRQTEMVTQLTKNGDRGVTQNIKEHKEHSEASPSPLDSAASASPKNGQQGNGEDREINPETLAKMDRMGVKLTPKPIPRDDRWKAPPQEIETFRRMGNGQDITDETMEPIKLKPPAIVLEAGRLNNVSIFPSPVVSGGDPFPNYPDLPDFLDRRAKHRATEAAA